MTNKSTEDKLLDLELATKLRRFIPKLRGRQGEARYLSLSNHIYNWATKPTSKSAALRAAARAHFGQFVVGEKIDDLIYMKRVSRRTSGANDFSDEVWSVRILAEPQHRFFGAFALEDWFVVLTMQSRNYLNAKDQRWHAEIDRVARIWESLLPGNPRFRGTKFEHYVSFNSEHCDDRWKEI